MKKTQSSNQKPTLEMDEGARKWMYKYIHKNYWKVAGFMEFEDLLQEGYLCYYATKDRYYDHAEKYNNVPVENINHLMALFQRSLFSQIVDLAKKRTKFAAETPSDDLSSSDLLPAVEDSTIIAHAPEPIQKVLRALMNKPEELRKSYAIKQGRRETTNERLCALANLDAAQFNLPQMIRNYLV